MARGVKDPSYMLADHEAGKHKKLKRQHCPACIAGRRIDTSTAEGRLELRRATESYRALAPATKP